jgi:anti-sigma B factor antagonist
MAITMHSDKNGDGKFAIEGEMTIYEAATFKEELLSTLQAHEAVELDLSGVQEIDSAGLQLLLLVKREAAERERQVGFSNHSQAVLDVFDLCGLFHFFGDQVVYVVKDGR